MLNLVNGIVLVSLGLVGILVSSIVYFRYQRLLKKKRELLRRQAMYDWAINAPLDSVRSHKLRNKGVYPYEKTSKDVKK